MTCSSYSNGELELDFTHLGSVWDNDLVWSIRISSCFSRRKSETVPLEMWVLLQSNVLVRHVLKAPLKSSCLWICFKSTGSQNGQCGRAWLFVLGASVACWKTDYRWMEGLSPDFSSPRTFIPSLHLRTAWGEPHLKTPCIENLQRKQESENEAPQWNSQASCQVKSPVGSLSVRSCLIPRRLCLMSVTSDTVLGWLGCLVPVPKRICGTGWAVWVTGRGSKSDEAEDGQTDRRDLVS